MSLRKTAIAAVLLTLAGFCLAGCGNDGSASQQADADALPETGVIVPTEEEADAEAAAAIDEGNADEAFNELAGEIEKELEAGDR